MNSISYKLTLFSLILVLITSNLDIHADFKTVIYGLSAVGFILGGYLSIKNKEV